jgi:hemoglobin-like flavoprotein
MSNRNTSVNRQAQAAPFQAAAAVVNNTVTQLFRNKVYKAQAEQINMKSRLDQLSNSQQYALSLKLQAANSEAEQFRIMQDAVSKIDVATVEGNAQILSTSVTATSKNTTTILIVVAAGIAMLIGAYYVINKK